MLSPQDGSKLKELVPSKYFRTALPDDPRFCILFDFNGFIAGFQVGVLANDVADMQALYDMTKFDLYKKKTFLNEDVWTVTAYTVSPGIIRRGGRHELNDLTGDGRLWLETTDDFVEIPKYETDLDGGWTLQSCIPGMGTHYYYNITESADCEDFQPWFLLFDNGQLTGVGYQAFGTATTANRSWYEAVPWYAIRPTIPTAPECLINWARDYTIISLHIYFAENPWDISC